MPSAHYAEIDLAWLLGSCKEAYIHGFSLDMTRRKKEKWPVMIMECTDKREVRITVERQESPILKMSTNLSCVKKAATMQNLSCLRIQKDPARGKEKKD